MNGGVTHAVECLAGEELADAAAGFRYFGFNEVASLLEEIGRGELADTEDADVRSTDTAGHMAVQGHLGDRTPDGYRLSLHFGFTFDPGLLTDALRDFRALRGGSHAQLR
jgi:hypothetical protein